MSLRDPDLRLHTGRYYDLTQAEDWEKTMRQIVCAVELKEQIKDKRLQQALPSAMCYYSESFSMRISRLEAWNTNQARLVRLADVHSWRYFLILYQRGIEREKNKSMYPMLRKMSQLMGALALK
ncbi:hypothetical protein BGZ51_008925 [Haplosporangium sp. Z 767]|nr:hypothetical protein BGZ51_008925 [Haplosporangium sp. Z 767]